MSLASDSSWYAEHWPGLFLIIVAVCGALFWRALRKGKKK